jgi:hypothetical protein
MSATEPVIGPEPRREQFASDEEHSRAWMQWAERTPGGWRARVADHVVAASTPSATPAPDAPTPRSQTSCCASDVLLDPMLEEGRRLRGVCTVCLVVVDDFGDRFDPSV